MKKTSLTERLFPLIIGGSNVIMGIIELPAGSLMALFSTMLGSVMLYQWLVMAVQQMQYDKHARQQEVIS